MADADREGKTEKATGKQRERFRDEGNVGLSKEIISVVVLFSTVATLCVISTQAGAHLTSVTRKFLGQTDLLAQGDPRYWLSLVVGCIALLVLPAGAVAMVAAIVSGGVQTKWLFTFKSMRFSLSKFNPLPKLAQMFASKNAVMQLAQSLGKVAVVGLLTYRLYSQELPQIINLGQRPLGAILSHLAATAVRLSGKVWLLFLLLAIADLLWKRYNLEEDMKMTKQEVKDEHKQSEGDPKVKGKQRQKGRELVFGQMIAKVPQADVVVVNPTHFSVALKYDALSMAAPKVVAKGKDNAALRIREVARQHGVPVMHNPPLARKLFAHCGPDDEVPAELYAAVAELLALVYQLPGAGLRRAVA